MSKIIGKHFTLYIEKADGEFEPIPGTPSYAAPRDFIQDETVELTGTFSFSSWVDRWKLQAWLTPPL